MWHSLTHSKEQSSARLAEKAAKKKSCNGKWKKYYQAKQEKHCSAL